MRKVGVLLIGVLTIYGCAKKVAPSSSVSESYSEDLSILHPVITPPVDNADGSLPDDARQQPIRTTGPLVTEADITEELDSLTLLIAEKNQQKRYVDGFTVQVYSGPSRDKANSAKYEVQSAGLDLRAQVVYVQPNYRVRVGRFYSRLEANRVYSQMKELFPNPLLLPEKFPID